MLQCIWIRKPGFFLISYRIIFIDDSEANQSGQSLSGNILITLHVDRVFNLAKREKEKKLNWCMRVWTCSDNKSNGIGRNIFWHLYTSVEMAVVWLLLQVQMGSHLWSKTNEKSKESCSRYVFESQIVISFLGKKEWKQHQHQQRQKQKKKLHKFQKSRLIVHKTCLKLNYKWSLNEKYWDKDG